MAVLYSPWGNSQFFDANGDPANGWKIYTYVAGSSTPLATYTDSTGTVSQSNPIVINSLGFPTTGQIWLTSGLSYKLVLTDASDVVKKTQDNLSGVISSSSSTTSQWVASGLTPTYVSATSFTLSGDQTSTFHVGRRLQTTNTSGTIYSRIVSSVYGALTTVTVVNDSGVLDSGLSAVNYGLLTAVGTSSPGAASPVLPRIDVASVAGTVDLTGNAITDDIRITGTNTITAFTIATGRRLLVTAGGAFTLTNNASIVTQTGANITCSNGDTFWIRATAANVVEILSYASATPPIPIPIRQTVLSGTVDSNGYSSFGGSTGSTTVTTSTTLIVTAANGSGSSGQVDRIGSIVNPSFTSLSTNGTMYGYLDINADRSCTAGTGTLAPIYQWGGTPSVTNGQFTFNIQEMKGYVGNGSTAVQTYRIYVGEFTIAGAVVTAITWYALMGRFKGTNQGLTASTVFSQNHNIGVTPMSTNYRLVCLTAENGYSVGDIVVIAPAISIRPDASHVGLTARIDSKVIAYVMATTSTMSILNKTTGAFSNLTNANWNMNLDASRGW